MKSGHDECPKHVRFMSAFQLQLISECAMMMLLETSAACGSADKGRIARPFGGGLWLTSYSLVTLP